MQPSPPLPLPAYARTFDWNTWRRPGADWSHCPFWFWNDTLDEAEILRQIDTFQAHGVEAFVIHPRIGLPRSIGWLSDALFHFMRVALEQARQRGMWVLLYDEGMYPSGSASGKVVASNRGFQARGLVCHSAGSPLAADAPAGALRLKLADAGEVLVYDRPVEAVVRGLHYSDNPDDPASPLEEEPPAADLLNPEAVQCFIRLVYDRFHAELGEYFGTTVKGIFTDEPHPLSRLCEQGVMPGALSLLPQVGQYLGYDFTPHLPALWLDTQPQAKARRRDYRNAIAALLDASYYKPLSRWCERHGIALTGHPAEPDDIGHLRHLQIPGQDIVWRHILPATSSALEGAPSTMAKAAASVKFHLGRARNLNEFAGAYGPELTFNELRWLASWLLIRGCDMLVPHAFYYSLRGPRRHERPPNVGPGSPWWGKDYARWEAFTRRLCWLNATCTPVCEVAILGSATRLPWQAAKACFENQIDFHYIEPADLRGARVASGRLHIGPGRYKVAVIEPGYEAQAAHIPRGVTTLHWNDAQCIRQLRALVAPAVALDAPATGLRARLLEAVATSHCGLPAHALCAKGGATADESQPTAAVSILLLFNESEALIRRQLFLSGLRLDPQSGAVIEHIDNGVCPLELPAHEWAVFLLEPEIPGPGMHDHNAPTDRIQPG